METSSLRTLGIFFNKCWKEKLHYKWRNSFFSILPIIITILIATIDTNEKAGSGTPILGNSSVQNDAKKAVVCYFPDNTFTNKTMQKYATINNIEVVGYQHEEDCDDYVFRMLQTFDFSRAKHWDDLSIEFDEDQNISATLVKKLHSEIKSQYITVLMDENQDFFQFSSKISPLPKIQVKKFSYFVYFFMIYAPTFMIFNVLMRLVDEKRSGFRNQLRTVTRLSQLNELTHFFVNLLQLLLIIIACWLIGLVASIWEGNRLNILALIVLFVFSLEAYTFFISVFFKKANSAMIGSTFFYGLPFIFYYLSQKGYEKFFLIFPLNSIYKGIDSLERDMPHSLIGVYRILTISTAIFIILFYIVTEYRLPSIISECLYSLFKRKNICEAVNFGKYLTPVKKGDLQPLSILNSNENLCVTIRGLTKEYPTKSLFKKFSMDLYEKSITALVGHSGSGKTTLLKIIAGLLPKTSGEINVESIFANDFQSKIGYCPQQSMVLPYFTCKEHIEFYGMLRGVPKEEINGKADNILKSVDLAGIDNIKHSEVGNKKKLNIGCALIGDTRLLILDEPSSGIDPESRKSIWTVLQKIKETKKIPILFTTYFMHEAEELADQVSVLGADDDVFGSPSNLKEKFGKGYTLTLKKKKDFNEQYAYEIIRKHKFKYIKKESGNEDELLIFLPHGRRDNYDDLMLDLIETEGVNVEISNLSDATLDEVYMNAFGANNQSHIALDSEDSGPDVPSGYKLWFRQFCGISYKKFIYWKRNFLLLFFTIFFTIFACLLIKLDSKDVLELFKDNIKDQNYVIFNFGKFNNEESLESLKSYTESYITEFVEDTKYVFNELDLPIKDLIEKKITEDKFHKHTRFLGFFDINEKNGTFDVQLLYSPHFENSSLVLRSMITNIMMNFKNESSDLAQNITSPKLQEADFLEQNFFTVGPMCLMLFLIMFLPQALRERATGFKKLQNIKPTVYWISTFFIDFSMYLLFTVSLVLVNFLKSDFCVKEITLIILLCLTYGLVYLTIIYIISQVVRNTSTAMTILGYLHMISIILLIVFASNSDDMKNNELWITISHIIPDFALKNSLKLIFERKSFDFAQAAVGHTKDSAAYSKNYQNLESIFNFTQYFIFMSATFIIGFFLVFITDRFQSVEQLIEWIKKPRKPDVEMGSIGRNGKSALLDHDELLVANNLSKEFNTSKCCGKTLKHEIINNVSFKVPKGKCYGMIGPNGVGKTTTMEILTANLLQTSGQCYIKTSNDEKIDSIRDRYLYRQQIGYCPQIDAIAKYMTAKEMLNYMMMIKGYSCEKIKSEVDMWLNKTAIKDFEDVVSKNYSGGTKRKLNIAMGMIGDPKVVCLDEPTTGIDPLSRQLIWKNIKKSVKSGQTIFLTTLSLEECEMLCSNILFFTKNEHKEYTMSEFKRKFASIVILQLSFKKGIIDGSKTDAELCKLYFDSQKGEYEYLKNFEFTDRRNDVMYFTYHSEDPIDWIDLFNELWNFMNNSTNKAIFEKFSVGKPSLESIFSRIMEEENQNNQN